MKAFAVGEADGVGAPVDVGLEAVEPWLAEDDVEVLKGGGVELVGVDVRAEGEALFGKKEAAGL